MSNKQQPIIKCNNITFSYNKQDSKAALKNLSVEIEPGEFVCVIGANGSGKSTLAKMFNALLIPDSGAVEVTGLRTDKTDNVYEIRQRVGMVFQNPDNQIVATIVEEDVAFGPENLGIKPAEIRTRVDNALKAVNMYDYRMHAPHLLSGGQKQRIAIAGILAISPQIIVFDESTAMLDPNGRREVLETIYELHQKKNITVILITHHMDEIVKADRVLVMSQGEIAFDDSPRNIFQKGLELHKYGLDVPQITALATMLRQSGLNITNSILTVEEMVEAICQLK